MKLNSKVTNTSSNEEFALTDSELETVLGGHGWDCSPSPCDGGSPNYGGGYPNYGGGSPNYGGGSPNYGGGYPNYGGGSSCGGSSPNYGGGYSPNSNNGAMYSVTTTTTTYYMGNPTPSGSSCGGGY